MNGIPGFEAMPPEGMHSSASEAEQDMRSAYEVGRAEFNDAPTDSELAERLGAAESTVVMANEKIAQQETRIEMLEEQLTAEQLARLIAELHSYSLQEKLKLAHERLDKLASAHEYVIRERDEARREANEDALTGLQNQNAYIRECAAEKDPDKKFGIMYVDLNALKAINDRLGGEGHSVGDEVLAGLGAIILRTIIETNVDLGDDQDSFYRGKAFRTGGDEIKLWIDPSVAAAIAKKLRERFAEFLAGESEILSRSFSQVFSEKGFMSGLAIGYGDTSVVAEEAMHHDKQRFYSETGQDRRK